MFRPQAPAPDSAGAARDFYDALAPWYRMVGGTHVHHGLYTEGHTGQAARENLCRELADAAKIPSGARVLDAGCGLGGGAIFLAKKYDCRVRAITCSPVEGRIARAQIRRDHHEEKVHVEILDLHTPATWGHAAYDLVWCMESSEYCQDRALFFRRCFDALTPGGSLAMTTLTLPDLLPWTRRRLARQASDAILCAPLLTWGAYRELLLETGGSLEVERDLTREVAPTWARSRSMLNTHMIQKILAKRPPRFREFAAAVSSLDAAYAAGAMGYHLAVVRKPRK